MNNGIDELYENLEEKRKIKRTRSPYRLGIRKRRKDKKIIHSTNSKTVVLDKVLIDMSYKIYKKLYEDMRNDELIAYFGSAEINDLLTEMIDSSIVNGKEIIDLEATKRVFKENIFDEVYKIIQNEKSSDNKRAYLEDYSNFDYEKMWLELSV